jgi:hypothetical protein
MAVYVDVPLVYAAASYQGQVIGIGRVNPFDFSPISDARYLTIHLTCILVLYHSYTMTARKNTVSISLWRAI